MQSTRCNTTSCYDTYPTYALQLSRNAIGYRVYDWIEEAIDVAEPDKEREEPRFDLASWVGGEEVIAHAHCVDDVDGKERHPAEKKDACDKETEGNNNKMVIKYVD